MIIICVFLKKTLWPLFMDGVKLPQGYSHFEEAIYFLPFSSQKFLVLILSTSEGWKAESTLEPPSGFWTRDPWIGNPALLHYTVFQPWQVFCCSFFEIISPLSLPTFVKTSERIFGDALTLDVQGQVAEFHCNSTGITGTLNLFLPCLSFSFSLIKSSRV